MSVCLSNVYVNETTYSIFISFPISTQKWTSARSLYPCPISERATPLWEHVGEYQFVNIVNMAQACQASQPRSPNCTSQRRRNGAMCMFIGIRFIPALSSFVLPSHPSAGHMIMIIITHASRRVKAAFKKTLRTTGS